MWHYRITQSQHCNNDSCYNDDTMMHVSVWFEFFGGLFWCQYPWNVKSRCEIQIENICSLWFLNIRGGVTLRRLILHSLECTYINFFALSRLLEPKLKLKTNTRVDGPYLITCCYFLSYTTRICGVEIYVCLRMYQKKT